MVEFNSISMEGTHINQIKYQKGACGILTSTGNAKAHKLRGTA